MIAGCRRRLGFVLARLVLAVLCGSGLALGARTANAQVVPPKPPLPRDTVRADSTRRPGPPGSPQDSASRAPTGPRELVKWLPTDSLFDALSKREGYHATRYQGDTVRFAAQDRALTLSGKPAAIERDQTLLVGRSVVYNDSTQIVIARPSKPGADTVFLRSPDQADVIVRDTIRYDVATERGIISGFSTAADAAGENWRVSGARGAVVADTSVQGGRIFFVHNGAITSCQDSVPHYHFQARDIKYVQKNLLVVRPAVLYIGDVPVLWLPFIFQDARSGRRSGILTPRFGIAELVRNSSNYHRSLENLGYYFNMGDYADGQAWFDWRSGANGQASDPGWLRFNAESRYRIVNRFLQGRFSASYLAQRDGSRNTAISLQHEQSFNQNRRLSANINWVKSTTLQRQNSINPAAVVGTISSQVNLQDKFGPFSVSLGGTRKQYSGRPQVDQDFPSLNLTTRTISVTPWLEWTPTASFSNSQSFNLDQGVQFDTVFARDASGLVEAKRVKASLRNSTASFDTPVKIFNYQLQNSFRFTESVQDYPQTRVVYRNVADSTTKETRVFNQTFTSNLFWQTGFSLPQFLQGSWNVSPTVSFANIDPQYGLFVRSERTGGRWVSQGFRTAFGLSSAPTIYAFPPGFGPIERFRHSINPSFSYSYSPAAKVSDEFLSAIGGRRQGYLGALSQSQVSLQLSTNLEAKMRAKAGDSTKAGAAASSDKKVRLLSMNFTGLSYDFIIADSVGGSFFNRRGITNQTFGYSARSDLVPGLDFNSNYSLFLGSPQSDTAVFKPYMTDISVRFTLDRNSALFNAIGRLFGVSPSTPAGNSPPNATTNAGNPRGGDQFFSQQATAQQVAGSGARNAQFDMPTNQAWQASFSFTSSRQRPDIRGSNIIEIDPTVNCQAELQRGSQIGYDICIAQAQTQQQAGTVQTGITTQGGAIYRQQPTQSIQANTSFHLTQKWGAQWNTTYDLVRSQFASNVVSLQRELHDWRAVFAFTQSPNGNFAFNFFVALKAEPDLKFDYNRNTYRSATGSSY